MERHYEVLGLPPTADEREVRRAYRTLLKEHHPNQGGSRERFLRIQRAYEELVGERPPEHDADETERYLFELRPLVRERLDRLPF